MQSSKLKKYMCIIDCTVLYKNKFEHNVMYNNASKYVKQVQTFHWPWQVVGEVQSGWLPAFWELQSLLPPQAVGEMCIRHLILSSIWGVPPIKGGENTFGLFGVCVLSRHLKTLYCEWSFMVCAFFVCFWVFLDVSVNFRYNVYTNCC